MLKSLCFPTMAVKVIKIILPLKMTKIARPNTVQSSPKHQRDHKILSNYQANTERKAEIREISQHGSSIALMAMTTHGSKIKAWGTCTMEIPIGEAVFSKLGFQRTTTS